MFFPEERPGLVRSKSRRGLPSHAAGLGARDAAGEPRDHAGLQVPPARGDRTGLPSAAALSPSKKAVGFEPGTKKKVGTSIRFLANFGAELKGFWELHHCSYYREL